MENGLAIKVYKMDYSFLIKNYLNPEMWQKEWTLFEYKNFKVNMHIWLIQTRNQQIMLDIRLHYCDEDGNWDYKEQTITFSMKIEDITFLKRQINSAIFNCMVSVEKYCFITKTEQYQELLEMRREEKHKLYDIARDFLEEHGVTNDNLVEAYTDAYIDEYSKVPDMMSDYMDGKIYTELTDLYLVWLETLEDDPKKDIRANEIKQRLGEKQYEQVLEEIQEFKDQFGTEEYEMEMKSNLEEV